MIAKIAEVSVVIPLFNKASFIAECLESVFRQSLKAREILVVDDGSEDGGADLVLSVAKDAGREVRLIRQANGGVSAARNRGIEEATSSWVAFLDGDDTWDPSFLAECVRGLESQPGLGAVFGAIIEVDDKGSRRILPEGRGLEVINDYPIWYIRHRGLGLSGSSSVVSRAAILAAGAFPPGMQNGEDTDTWFRLAGEVQVAYVPGARAYYRKIDTQSLSRRFRARRPPVLDSIARMLVDEERPRHSRASLKVAASYFHAAYALALAQEGRRWEASLELAKVRLGPPLLRAWARALLAILVGR